MKSSGESHSMRLQRRICSIECQQYKRAWQGTMIVVMAMTTKFLCGNVEMCECENALISISTLILSSTLESETPHIYTSSSKKKSGSLSLRKMMESTSYCIHL